MIPSPLPGLTEPWCCHVALTSQTSLPLLYQCPTARCTVQLRGVWGKDRAGQLGHWQFPLNKQKAYW